MGGGGQSPDGEKSRVANRRPFEHIVSMGFRQDISKLTGSEINLLMEITITNVPLTLRITC